MPRKNRKKSKSNEKTNKSQKKPEKARKLLGASYPGKLLLLFRYYFTSQGRNRPRGLGYLICD
jgi:hypothetical protein